MLLELNSLIQSVVEIINTKTKDKPSKLFQDFNASVQFIPNHENGQNAEKKLFQVEFPQHNHSIENINKVKLRSLNHSFNNSELYVQSSVPSIKLIKKKKIEKSVSDCSSTRSPVGSNYSFQIDESYFEDDHFHSSFRPQSPSDNSNSDKNWIISVVTASSNDEMYE